MEDHWTFGQFIVGVIVAGIGFVLVWKANWFYQNFGAVPFAEKFLSTEGGSRLFYKLLGILIMIGGLMHATALLSPMIAGIANRLFGEYGI